MISVQLSGMRTKRKRRLPLLAAGALLLALCAQQTSSAAAAAADKTDALLPPVGSALVEAGDGRWSEAAADTETFAALWREAKASQADPELAGPAAKVDAALAEASKTLQAGGGAPAKAALSTLAGAVDAYVTAAAADGGQGEAAGPEAAAKLLPAADRAREAAGRADWDAARKAYSDIAKGWTAAEQAIRQSNAALYGQLETKMSLLRIALQAEPVRADAAKTQAEALYRLLDDYSAGRTTAAAAESSGAKTPTIDSLIASLQKAKTAVQGSDAAAAAAVMETFITDWPSAEGKVQVASPSAYTYIENESATAAGYLESSPPKLEKAAQSIDGMLAKLTPLAGESSYTAWDAALVLLREGMEAVLVLAALLAYLKRSDSPQARKWVWSGAVSGLILSLALAAGLTYAVSLASAGGTREAIEGITGLVAVVMMLFVSRWLHAKSNTQAWNRYVGRQVEGALAKGNLWSLFLISALAILREGAETTIFYAGMAPSMETSQLLTGIAGALAVLVLAAYAVITLSAKLPIGLFFRTASLLIYFLIFRFLGESIHALQVAGSVPAHSSEVLPSISGLGLYPTWESQLPQAVLLLALLFGFLRSRLFSAPRAAE
ncbi:Ferrous iron permease EfeU precursor [compost metagenome]